ncbi:class I adenylate-forming enzyme family protein [Pseudomonas monteilii]|uniref:class I adenylate-forming enzyme family protein n=1 Tax=Pseudomonas monteilii TaxID=76759 RepID=UPI00383A69ED
MNQANICSAAFSRHPSYAKLEAIDFPESIPALLNRAAERFGNAEAITFFEQDESLSFKDLRDTAYSLAHALHYKGVSKGSHVALLLSNRIEYPVAWLALAILGAVAVPTITASTPRELRFILNDADITHVIVEDKLLPTLRDAGEALSPDCIFTVGEPSDEYADYQTLLSQGSSAFRPAVKVTGQDLMNIQYTSGTTGLPKGVMQNHRFWIVAGCPMGVMMPDLKSILSDHPWYYIDPQWMFVTGLYSGARVDFTNGMSIKKFRGWLESRESSLVWFPDPLLKLPDSEQDKQNKMQLFMGYHLSYDMQKSVERRFRAPVRELYGMTEISLGISVPVDCFDEAAVGTCGIPGPFRQARIVDPNGNDVPLGTTGELWISGDGIFSGYYNRPEINAELIVDGWFRTGDIFCQDENGYYNIVGRIKDMIKRSGENIAALEVEQVLVDMPEIEDAAIVAVPDPDRDQEVKAYIKLRDGVTKEQRTVDSILEHCLHSLAKFKIPRYIEFVESFTYTPSNKIAKHLLVKGVDDLREKSYDAVDKVWR